MRKAVFCDSSAIVKLVVPERESVALSRALESYDLQTASDVALVEVPRAVRRRKPALEAKAHHILASFHCIAITEGVTSRAAVMNPIGLRSLDAVQLATALRVSFVDIDFIAYDQRLLEAAAEAGLETLSPT